MAMNCVHHVMWIVPVQGGLHACIQCKQVVRKKDITPSFDDLPLEFKQEWEAHEQDTRLGSGASAGNAAF
jgi:hypothetical protein